MASNIVEQARVAVTLDGKPAEEQLNSLTESVNEYTNALLKAYQAGDKDALKKASKDLEVAEKNLASFKKQTFETAKVLNNLNGSSLNDLKRAEKEIVVEMAKMTRGTKEYIAANNNLVKVRSEISKVRTEMGGVSKAAGFLKGLLPVVGFAALAAGAKQLVSKMISVSAEFQKYQAVLSTALGSEREARIEMNNIKDIASKTPFSVNELTDAYVKLVNQGFKPTTEQMIAMGDLASSTGKGFGQLTEAIIDAQTGEFERLKEFGVRAKKEGDQVKFTFKGVETQVAFTNEAIQNYVIGLGQTEGVTGSMAKISGTLGGQISNLGDSWTQLLDTLGNKSGGIFTTVIGWLNNIVSGLKMASMSIEQIKQEVMDSTLKEALINDEKELNDMAISLEEKYKKAGIELEGMSFKQKAATLLISQYKNLLTSLTPEEEDRKANIVEQIKALEKIAVVQEKVITKTDEQIKKEKEAADKAAKAADEAVKARQKVLDDLAALQDEYLRSQMDKQNQEIFAVTDKYDKIYEQAIAANSDQKTLDAIRAQENLALEDLFVQQKKEADDKKEALEKEFQDKRKQYLEEFLPLTQQQMEDAELSRLDETYKDKLGYEEEYQQLRQAIIDKYNALDAEKDETKKKLKLEDLKEIAAATAAISDTLLNVSNTLQDTEIAKLEASTAKKLELAGDDAKEREKIEKESAEKQKQIKKKYAGVNFAIQIASIIATTAEAAMSAYKSMASIPFVGPVLGAIAAGATVAYGAVQIKNAKAQRDIAMQAKSGRYPVIGAEDKKLYHADYYGPVSHSGIINGGRPTLINEQGGELILTAPHTQNIARLNPALFNTIMSYRVPQRAEGSVPSTVSTTTQPVDNSVNVALVNAINQLVAQIAPGIKAYVVLSELNTQQDKLTKIQDRAAGK